MGVLSTLGRGLDTAVLGGTFRQASQDREMHRLDVDRIKQNMEFQRQNQIRQKSIDSINQARAMAEFDDTMLPVQGDRVQQTLNPMQQQEAANAGVIGLQQYERPIDPARRSDIQLQDGTTRTMERRTPEDLVAQGLGRERQSIKNKSAATAEGDDEIRKRLGVDVPVGGRTIRMTPGELAHNPKLFDDMGRRRIIPGFEQYGPISPDEFGGTASLDDNTNVNYRPFVNYGTGDVTFGGINPKTGKPSVVKDPALQGVASPRPRQGARGGGRGELTEYQQESLDRRDRDFQEKKAKEVEAQNNNAQAKIDKIQAAEDKLWSEKDQLVAKLEAGVSRDKKGSAADNEKAIRARIVAIDKAAGRMIEEKKKIVSSRQGSGGGSRNQSPASGGKVTKRFNPQTGRLEDAR